MDEKKITYDDQFKLYQTDIRLMARCFYRKQHVNEIGDIWVCIIHGQTSKHINDPDINQEESIMPCLALDPWDKPKEEK